MIPYPHQVELAERGLEIVRKHGIVYLACEERTGKTLASILIAENSVAKSILVVTKKKAMEGWIKTFKAFKHTKRYDVSTYHQAYKLANAHYDLVILDEAHNYISAFPKPGKMWRELRPMLVNKPIIYMSATPHAQGPQMLFNQFALSTWSPWKKHKNFYQWFRLYGFLYELKINGLNIRQYDRCNVEMILATCEHLFITKTRKELGFEHEPEDILHYIELSKETKELYNTIVEDEIVQLGSLMLVCDTVSKMRFSLHMLEGGVVKTEEEYIVLANREKIDYVLDNFGDSTDNVIMYNYKAERTKLEKHFKKSRLLQATSFAEGVDLSDYTNLIIYSQDFSTARHTQRRARQCNMQRESEIRVHFLLVKGGLSEQVYKTVSKNKRNFVDSVYTKGKL